MYFFHWFKDHAMYKNLEERRKSEGKPEHGTLLLWKIERVELV